MSSATAPSRGTYDALQNGSDVRGVAMEGVEGEDINLTSDAVKHISAAFVEWLSEREGVTTPVRIAVGRDSRLTGESLVASMAEGVTGAGGHIYDTGLGTTPAMFMACITDGFSYDGSVMLTASHLPFNRNGMKFFTKDGGLNKKDIKAILDKANTLCAEGSASKKDMPPGEREQIDFMPVYAAQLVDTIRKGVNSPVNYEKPLEGMHVLVDAGNGSGGYFVDKVLAPLGAKTEGSQFLEPDGTFPNHVPNPEDKEAMAMASEALKKANADLAIVFDTDVDRSGLVDKSGKEFNKNLLIAAISAVVLRETPGATIVTDSVTSNGLAEFIQSLGGVHYRYRRGYKNVIDKGVELNKSGQVTPLMIETSGHGALMENHFLDDGAYLAVKLLIEVARRKLDGDTEGLMGLVKGLKEPTEAREMRMKIDKERYDYTAYGSDVLNGLKEFVSGSSCPRGWSLEEVNHEGWRINVDEGGGKNGWLLLRQSLHDPIMPLNVESEMEGGVAAIVADLLPFLERFDGLDLSVLK